jgi:hypothetical protein
MKQIFKTTLLLLSFVLLCGCEETLIPIPPKDASEYISPLEDGNKWVFKLTTKHVITEIVGNDTTTSQRDVYMTQVIQGDSLFNGKICKKLYYYFHYKPTVGKGDTVYMGEKFPRIFPDAHYICSDKENLYYGNADEHPDDVFIRLAQQFYVAHYTSPVLLYEKDFVIAHLHREDDTWYESPVIALNITKGDLFRSFEVRNASSITMSDGKSRRVMQVRTERFVAPKPKYYTTYWIEGIGCIVNGINPTQTRTIYQPSKMLRLVSFSTNGQEIYTDAEYDYTPHGLFLDYTSDIYTTYNKN